MKVWVVGVEVEVAEGAKEGEGAAGGDGGWENVRAGTNESEKPLSDLGGTEPEEQKILRSDFYLHLQTWVGHTTVIHQVHIDVMLGALHVHHLHSSRDLNLRPCIGFIH